MNTVVQEKILGVLSDENFYKVNQDLSEPEDIIKAIQALVPDATDEEIDSILSAVSEELQKRNTELNEEDLDMVAGGFAITLTVTGVLAILGAAGAAGGAIGGAIWYWKHRKCQPE